MTDLSMVTATLAENEAIIERGLVAWQDAGAALTRIRDGRQYRDTHATFEDYCRERWGWTHGRADQMIRATEVVGLLDTTVSIDSERQARELAPLRDQPEVLRAVWGEVVDSGQTITASVIRTAVRDRIRGLSESSEAELQVATATWSDGQRDAFRPELVRQRGEVVRLLRDVAHLPEPFGFAEQHGSYLPPDFLADAATARGWLAAFCDGLEGKR